MTTECARCRELQAESLRLAQRLTDAERRITTLTYAVERLERQLSALRRSA